MILSTFFLIPTAEITQAMLNKSVSNCTSMLPIKTINYIDFYILEVELDVLKYTHAFDNYRPYNRKELETAAPVPSAQTIRFAGLLSDTVNAASNKTTTYTFDATKFLTGVSFKAHAYSFGDNIDVVVKDPLGNIIATFVSGWFVDSQRFDLEVIKSQVVSGIKIEVTYRNVGALPATWSMNFKLWSQ